MYICSNSDITKQIEFVKGTRYIHRDKNLIIIAVPKIKEDAQFWLWKDTDLTVFFRREVKHASCIEYIDDICNTTLFKIHLD